MSSGEDADLSDDEYWVEYILAARAVEDDPEKDDDDDNVYPGWEYLLKWDGFPETEAEWKHGRQMGDNLDRLLKSFWREINGDPKTPNPRKFAPDEELTASDEWRRKESKRFQREKAKDQAEKAREEAELRAKEQAAKRSKGKAREEDPKRTSVAASSTSRAQSSAKQSAGSSRQKKGTKRKANERAASVETVPSAASSDDDAVDLIPKRTSRQSRPKRSTRSSGSAPIHTSKKRKQAPALSPARSVPSAANSDSEDEPVPRPQRPSLVTAKNGTSSVPPAAQRGITLENLAESSAKKALKPKKRGNVVHSDDEEDGPTSPAVKAPLAVAKAAAAAQPSSKEAKASDTVQKGAPSTQAKTNGAAQKGPGPLRPQMGPRKTIAGATPQTSVSSKVIPPRTASAPNPRSTPTGRPPTSNSSSTALKRPVAKQGVTQSAAVSATGKPVSASSSTAGLKKPVGKKVGESARPPSLLSQPIAKEATAASDEDMDKDIDALFDGPDEDEEPPEPAKAPVPPPPVGRKVYKAVPRPVLLYDATTDKITEAGNDGIHPIAANARPVQQLRNEAQISSGSSNIYAGLSFKKKPTAAPASVNATTPSAQEPFQKDAAADVASISMEHDQPDDTAMEVDNASPRPNPLYEELSDYEDSEEDVPLANIPPHPTPASPSVQSPPVRGMHPPLPTQTIKRSPSIEKSLTPVQDLNGSGPGPQPQIVHSPVEMEDGELAAETTPPPFSFGPPPRPQALEMDPTGWPKPIILNGRHLAFAKLLQSQKKTNILRPSFSMLLNKEMPSLDINSTFAIAACLESRGRGWEHIQNGLLGPEREDHGAENDLANMASYLKDHERVAIAMHPKLTKYGFFLFSLASWQMMQALAVPIPQGEVKGRVVIVLVEFKSSWPSESAYRANLTSPQMDKPYVRHVLTKLHFPEHALKTTTADRLFAVVPQEHDVDPFVSSDARALVTTLTELKGRVKSISEFDEEDGVVLIHKRLLNDEGFVPDLVRLKRFPRVKIFGFGNGFLYPPHLLPLFVMGGIVTFTPQAILEDSSSVLSIATALIHKLDWQCYISPSVISSLHTHSHDQKGLISLMDLLMLATVPKNPMPQFKDDDPIENRLIITDCPFTTTIQESDNPDAQHHHPQALLHWLGWQWRFWEEDKPWDLLSMCDELARVNETNLDLGEVMKGVMEDMIHMQRQPSLVSMYRRFVVITSSAREGWNEYSGRVECCTLAEFAQSVPTLFDVPVVPELEPGEEPFSQLSLDTDIMMD